tara:strand:- start:451 stop:1038 length:588 start_codon:yes stop_codon:yes gene_type:complete
MSKCLTCNELLIDTYYKCTENDYRLEDTNNNCIFIKDTHNLDLDYEEVNTQSLCVYCTNCEEIIDYPTTYDSSNHNFKNGDLVVNDYYKHLINNIIHQFTNISCKYCNTNNLQKGYFTNTEVEQTEENKILYCYPEGIENLIHIYNENTNTKIKDITINLTELYPIPNTDIGKKILYCHDCNYFITNNLKEFYKD